MTIAELLGCGSKTNKREKDDFYATPPLCTHALLNVEINLIHGVFKGPSVWEPCAGDGAILRVLWERNIEVVATDLVQRGACESRIDFLMERKPLAPNIITNPPFKLANQFVRHAFDIGIEYMAMLLPASFPNSEKSAKTFDIWKPARIHALGWRPDFTGQGKPTMRCSWFVWQRGDPKETTFSILRKPK